MHTQNLPFFTTETISVDGDQVPVCEVELLQEFHWRVLRGDNGALYLEYPVSVGPYKMEISAIHALSAAESAARQAGRLDVGRLSHTLSEVAQITGRFERPDRPAAAAASTGAATLLALIHLVQMETAVLDRIAGAQYFSAKLTSMVTEMHAALAVRDSSAVGKSARKWGGTFGSIHRLVDEPFPDSPHFAEKTIIEKAIYATAIRLIAVV